MDALPQISHLIYISAVDMFLKKKSRYISTNAVLLYVTPLEVSGVKVNQESQLDPYTPFK